MNVDVIKIQKDTWSIEDGFVRFFLIKGEEKALLIDSGFDIEGVKKLAMAILKGTPDGGSWEEVPDGEQRSFTDEAIDRAASAYGNATPAPVIELLNTHGDGDHCYGNKEFDWFYMHEADAHLFRREHQDLYETSAFEGARDSSDSSSKQRGPEIRFVQDGDMIDLGSRPLEIIHIPGHTHGSIAILDVNHRVLFPGDSVQNGEIFMFGDHRNLDEYPASMMKLQEMEEHFDVLYASHAELKMEPDYIGECFDACESMMHGEVEPEEREVHGSRIYAYDCGVCTFLVDKKRLFTEL